MKFSAFVVLLLVVFLAPIGALFSAWIYSEIWDLLLAHQYGKGPSYEAWFGISLLMFLSTRHLARDNDDDKKDDFVRRAIVDVVGSYITQLLVLGLAYFVHMAVGWP